MLWCFAIHILLIHIPKKGPKKINRYSAFHQWLPKRTCRSAPIFLRWKGDPEQDTHLRLCNGVGMGQIVELEDLFPPRGYLVGGLEHGFYFPYIWNNHPNWLSYFQRGWSHQPAILKVYDDIYGHGDDSHPLYQPRTECIMTEGELNQLDDSQPYLKISLKLYIYIYTHSWKKGKLHLEGHIGCQERQKPPKEIDVWRVCW